MKNMGYGIRDSVKAAAAVLCLVNAGAAGDFAHERL